MASGGNAWDNNEFLGNVAHPPVLPALRQPMNLSGGVPTTPPPPPVPHKCKFKVNFLVPKLGGKSAWKHGEKATGWEGGEPIDCSFVTFQDLVEILKDGSNPPYTAVRNAALRSGIKEDQLRLVLCEKLPCDLKTSNPINLRGGASVKYWPLQHDSARVGASIPEDLIDLLRSEENPTLFLCNLCHSHSGDLLSNTYICKPNKTKCHECQKAATSKEKRGTCEIESNAPPTHRTICSQISFFNYADIFPWVTVVFPSSKIPWGYRNQAEKKNQF